MSIKDDSYYQDSAERMLAEIHKEVQDLWQEVHELYSIIVDLSQKCMKGGQKMKMEEMIANVEQWAEDRGILEKATPLDQFDKTMEEVRELEDHLDEQYLEGCTDKLSIKDDIGDITVTLIIQAKMQGLSFTDCLAYAWNEIKDRRGEMRGGQFVKEVEG
jgi:hypothetical protein